MRQSILAIASLAAFSVASGAPAWADDDDGIWSRSTLTGDWGGLRATLEKEHGITFTLQEQSEVWLNTNGGLNRGVTYDGQTLASVAVNLETLAGWKGGKFFASAYQIHGRGPTPNLTGNLQTISSLEATRATRLYDLWVEQTLGDGLFSIRVGQEGANDEFMLSAQAGTFINSSFGFPASLAYALPSGGPNYPLSSPMVRLQLKPTEALTFLAAVFDGNPAGPGIGDPQRRDASGTLFRMQDHPVVFLEGQYAVGSTGKDGRPGTYKLGGMRQWGGFSDQAVDTVGVSLASPASNGVPLRHDGDWALYGVADQILWRPAGEDTRGIGVFAQAIVMPDAQNPSNFFAMGGLTWTGPLGGDRAGDVLGVGFGVLHIGNTLREFGSASVLYTGSGSPYLRREAIFELTYQAKINNWWTLQPDLQYVINPGAGLPTASNGNRVVPLANTLTFGLRTGILF